MHTWAIILAAGRGLRLAGQTGGLAKQFLQFAGVPLYWHSVWALAQVAGVRGLVVVVPKEYEAEVQAEVAKLGRWHNLGLPCQVVVGGDLRQDSVRAGLGILPELCSHVLVHDAARPFVSADLVQRVLQGLTTGARAVIPAVEVVDTIKVVAGDFVTATLDRSSLRAVQTPQGFCRKSLEEAHKLQLEVTDDARLLEELTQVLVVAGEVSNVKITNAEDLELLKTRVGRPCVGLGYDVHRYARGDEGRPLRLGGVLIHKAPTVVAHSDGDVLLHALMDALLGCAALGDIGQHFPDSDSNYANISSAVLLDEVLGLLQQQNIVVQHVDLTIVAQIPKISHQREEIRRNVARLLSLDLSVVNVKATTEEGLGFTGSKEGLKAIAQVMAYKY